MEWKSELNLWTKTILTHGSEFLMNWTSWSQTRSTKSTTTTSRKPLKRRRKYLLLQADHKLKQNRADLPLLAHLQELYLSVKKMDWYWTRSSTRSSILRGKKTKHFSDTEHYLGKKMVQSNSGDWKMIFRTNLSTLNIGLVMRGRAILIRQEKFSTFELFKIIQDSIPLILHCKTMYWFRTISSSTFIMLDVRPIYTPSQIQDWYRENKNLAGTDKRCSLQPWIPCIRIINIQWSLIWPDHVLHLISKSGKYTKIRFTGSIFSLLNEKDWSSIK